MAQSTLHFAVGMAVGTAAAAPSLVRRIRGRRRTARCFLRWFALSYGLGFVAVIPSLLRHAGVARELCMRWWMNVFFLFPLIDRLQPGGMVLGEAAVLMLFGLQYVAMLLLIGRLERSRERETGAGM